MTRNELDKGHQNKDPERRDSTAELIEIRWHCRGGQGVATAGKLLAETALGTDHFFQAFPDYGPERMGAPIRAFTRLSPRLITIHAQIEQPDVVLPVAVCGGPAFMNMLASCNRGWRHGTDEAVEITQLLEYPVTMTALESAYVLSAAFFDALDHATRLGVRSLKLGASS